EPSQRLRADTSDQQSVAEGVLIEDVGETRGQHAADAKLHEGPDGGLARAAAAEVLVGDQDARPAERLLVEDEAGYLVAGIVVAPPGKQPAAEIGMRRAQPCGRDDGIGVDVGALEAGSHAGKVLKWRAHTGIILRLSVMAPAIAAAAVMAGLARWVRLRRPCLCSKLRFDVAMQRAPGGTRSSLILTHI